MKRYSVLIPAYNAEEYIIECVESVINQNGIEYEDLLSSVEIVIANDGSTDSTGEICNDLAEKHANIKVFHKENEGQLLTRVFLRQKASAEYILYLDADDKWESNLLTTLNHYIEEYNYPDIVNFGFNLWRTESLVPYPQIHAPIYCKEIEKRQIWPCLLCEDSYNSMCSKAIKNIILKKIRIDSCLQYIRRGEDKVQAIACLEAANSVLLIPENLYDYRIDNASMTRAFNPDYFKEVIVVDGFAFEKLKQHVSGTKKYYIKWGETVVNKFFDYVNAAYVNLPKNDALAYIKKYSSEETVKNAVSYAMKSSRIKTKIKAYIISFKLYGLLRYVYINS